MRGTARVSFAVVALLVITSPALAGYGAVAYGQEKRKHGAAWDEETQQRANEVSLRECGSDRCKVRFPVPSSMCAAFATPEFATPESGPAWGGAVRKSMDQAKFAALKNCQKHAKNKCAVRESKCNK